MGVLVGPAGLGWVAVGTELELLASLGIAVLLFLVGLKLEPKLIRTTGRVALATGLGQVAFASIFGFTIALALGLDVVPAIYVAVALAFSSTIIIVKLLSDKREIDTLHGRIAIGILIVQDILVILALTARDPIQAERLREVDVDVVIAPFAVAAEQLVDALLASPPEAGTITEDELPDN